MTKARVRFALAAGVLAAAAGCAQVFGLGDYGQQPEDAGGGGSDATIETGPAGDSGQGGDAQGQNPDGAGHTDVSTEAAADGADAGKDAPTFAADACNGGNVCAPTAPTGWTGPVALWEGTGSAPSCGVYYYTTFNGGLSPDAGAAQCVCSCGPPSGSTCGPVTVQFGTGGCTATCGSTTVGTTCANIQTLVSGCGTGVGFVAQGSDAAGGSCLPDASLTLPPTTWAMQAMVCQPTGSSPAGCTAGQECVPAAPGGFETHFCVTKAGSNSCPAGFPTQHLYYADVSDNRACGPCSCDPPTGVDCNANGRVTTWGNNMCTANQGASASPLPSGCMTASATHGLGFTTTPTGGSCAPTGGQPTGSVSPQTITTICCAP